LLYFFFPTTADIENFITKDSKRSLMAIRDIIIYAPVRHHHHSNFITSHTWFDDQQQFFYFF
jgi:hypothetical protein